MADKNRNGIDDSREPAGTRGVRGYVPTTFKNRLVQGQPASLGQGVKLQPAVTNTRSNSLISPLGGRRFFGTGGLGSGDPLGDLDKQITDRTPVDREGGQRAAQGLQSITDWMKSLANSQRQNRAEAPVDQQMTFAEILQQAMDMVGGGDGGGGAARISYDPQRATARDNAARADQALRGIYGALAKSIAGDAAGIDSSYGSAISNQQAITDKADQTIKAGYQSGNDMLTQQAAALGIGQAVGNQIQTGQAGAGDMTQRLADNAQQGAGAKTQLNTNRQTALDYNTAVKQAAEQEGAAQRAQRTAELAKVLGELDAREQEANASLAAQAGSAQNDARAQAMNLAQWMYEQNQSGSNDEWQKERDARELALTEWVAKQKYGTQKAAPTSPINNESTSLLMELLGMEDPAQFQQWIQRNPSGYASLVGKTR